MNRILYTLEAIDFQKDSPLGVGLLEKVSSIRARKKILVSDLNAVSKVIKDETNISVVIATTPHLNAFVLPPDLNKNNVMFKGRSTLAFTNADFEKHMTSKKEFKGMVDLKKGKVYGDFTLPFGQIVVSEHFFTPDSLWTPEEVVAIILHEIGHIFAIFEMIARISATNYYMLFGTERLLRAESKEKRIIILREIEDDLNIKIDDIEEFADKNSREAYATIFVSAAKRDSINQTGFNIYDSRAFEQLADQYVSRHGYGKHLVLALDKLHRRNLDRNYWFLPFHYIWFALEAASIWVFGATTFVILSELLSGSASTIITLFLHSPFYFVFSLIPFMIAVPTLIMGSNEKLYDDPKKRFEKVRNDIVGMLRDKTISDEERLLALNDIDVLDKLIASVHEYRSAYEFVWNVLIPFGRKEAKEIAFNEQLERMLNNDLYSAAARSQV